MMESIEKLRESLKDCTSEAGVEPNRFDTYWITARACDMLIDEIEAEIAEKYMKLPVDADGVPGGEAMSSDAMNFPDGWWRFVQQYQFADKEEIYTNGSMLIPSFRVRQMVEHYFGGEVGKTSRYSELFGTPERAARTLEEIKCDNDI